MTSPWLMIAPLALGTFAIRLTGALLGPRIPTHGAWARAMQALPGSLIVALIAVNLMAGGGREWAAAAVAALAAIVTRSLSMAMASGIFVIWTLRHFV